VPSSRLSGFLHVFISHASKRRRIRQLELAQSHSQSFVPLDQRSEDESSGSFHFEITKEITVFCTSGFIAQCAFYIYDISLHTAGAREIWIDQSGFSWRKNSSVLMESWQVRKGIEIRQLFSLEIFNFKNHTSWQKLKSMNHFVLLKFYFGAKNVRHGNSLVVRRVSQGRIIIVLFWRKYAVPRQIKPGILELNTSRGQRNLLTVFVFVGCEEKGCYRIVSFRHQNFDCRSYCGLRPPYARLWRMPEMYAPRALVFRPLVKGNEALGARSLELARRRFPRDGVTRL